MRQMSLTMRLLRSSAKHERSFNAQLRKMSTQAPRALDLISPSLISALVHTNPLASFSTRLASFQSSSSLNKQSLARIMAQAHRAIRAADGLWFRTWSSSSASRSQPSSTPSSSSPSPSPSPPPPSPPPSTPPPRRPRYFPPGRLLWLIPLLAAACVIARDILSTLDEELQQVREWGEAEADDTDSGDFDSLTVGAYDPDSPLNALRHAPLPTSAAELVVYTALLPLRVARRLILLTAYVLRTATLMARFGPLLLLLAAAVGADAVYSSLAALPPTLPLAALEARGDDDETDGPAPPARAPMVRFYALWWRLFAAALEHSGPAFTKLGQYLSSRPDVLTPGVCKLLAGLRDATEQHPWADTAAALEADLGPNWAHWLVIPPADRAPIGSGCIAQVYRGYVPLDLADSPMELPEKIDPQDIVPMPPKVAPPPPPAPMPSALLEAAKANAFTSSTVEPAAAEEDAAGRPALRVAVKVRHPGAVWLIHRDLRLLFSLASLVDALPLNPLSAVSTAELVSEFTRLMHVQLDLTQEARNLRRFQRNFARPRPGLLIQARFPTVVAARPSVLVESFHDGLPAAAVMHGQADARGRGNHGQFWRSLDEERKDWLRSATARCGLDTFLHMLFAHGFFHADMHPGNLILDLGYSDKQWQDALHAAARPPPAPAAPRGLTYWPRLLLDLPAALASGLAGPDVDITAVLPSEAFALVHPDDMRMHASARDPSAQFGAHWLPEPARAPALVILDAGMATALSARDQRNFTDLFLCIAQGEGERAASLLIERAKPRDGIVGGPETLTLANGNQITLRQVPYLPGQTAVHRARFIDTVAGLISEAASAGFLLKGVGVVSTLHALAAAARESYVGLDASFIAVVIAVTVMEGVGRALDDHCDVLTPAVAIAAKVTVRQAQMGVTRWLSGDNAPEAEDAIEENYVTK